jgi:hypothetical protein
MWDNQELHNMYGPKEWQTKCNGNQIIFHTNNIYVTQIIIYGYELFHSL